MEENITLLSENFQIEGCLGRNDTDKGVVITHPHPLYGGDMHNSVVETIMQAYRQKGFTTLRFNFRGVGASQGSYADGIGEQADVRAALSHLTDLGITRLDLAGYSFGAWVNAHLMCQQDGIQAMVMVSPPVAFIGFDAIDAISCLKLVVSGSHDDIAPPHLITPLKAKWCPQARFEIIEEADHFYFGHLDRLREVLAANI